MPICNITRLIDVLRDKDNWNHIGINLINICNILLIVYRDYKLMAMIDIEYRHSAEPKDPENIRRPSVKIMTDYLTNLVCEMQMADISSKFINTIHDGPNMLYINGKDVHDVLNGLKIKILDTDESCDHGTVQIVKFDRPTLDWKKDIIEDIPDILVKNAISKVFADINENRIL